ncbi:hypothetical protein RHGRI_019780 [Rhododendron griersonianum]|uniref:Uncharacterized protein n=1 Tax=Rhododendron griersonianum TaxID=479676 RepID=A0AAV6JGN7_9ERIC|nr:hypothetical protein RHGRI_019780 [Rhododendron griersonianum]
MRIQNPPPTSTSATPPPHSPPFSSSSPSSPPSSTITAASSTDSSQSSHTPSSSSSTRCEGLDLLVKAIHHVATGGSIVGVPYIQRRSVIRRRRRSNYLRFTQLFVTDGVGIEEREKGEGSGSEPKLKKQRRRVMALPSKYHDSVLQPWRLRSRSVIKIND